jgi:hypothetical protein
LEEIQTKADLPLELLLAELEGQSLFAHKSAYNYAHTFAEEPPSCQGLEAKKRNEA